MLRVSVVGTSCSGKTTLARKIAEANGIPYVELDAIYWCADWNPLPVEEFRRAVEVQVAADEWVVDGNYSKVRDLIWSRATHLVWLNLLFPIVFWRAVSRTLSRVITQEELFAGNRETLRRAVFDRDSILWWVIRTHRRRARKYRELIDDHRYPDLAIHEVTNSAEAQAVLLDLSDAG
jgi:adenylate kinase family enzyme